LKEKNQANTKKFMDERKNTAMKQNKKREKQKKLHETQLGDITQYIKSVSKNGIYWGRGGDRD
jgi:phosphatidylinositol phospholipase C beta